MLLDNDDAPAHSGHTTETQPCYTSRMLLETAQSHSFTVAEFMATDLEHVELLGGVVYDMPPRYEPHRFAVQVLTERLIRELPQTYGVRSQEALAIDGWHGANAPEADVAVITNRFHDPMPLAADAFVVIEVADSSYRHDRRTKMPLYVAAGIPAYLVNVRKRHVERYASPEELERPEGTVFTEADTLDILGVAIPVRSLFREEPLR